MRGLYRTRSAAAVAVAAVGLLLCVGRADGYAFSTNGPTASNGVTAAGSTTTTTTGSQPVQDNIDSNQNTNPVTTAPIFSGFGHVTDLTNGATTKDTSIPKQQPSPTATTAATFSGFGHAHGVSPVFPTIPQPSAPAPPPVFSGFGHALGLGANGVGGMGSGTPTAATIMPWGVVGASLQDTKNNDENDDDDDTFSSSMDPDLYEASQFLHDARDKVLQLRQELEQKANQQKELVQQLRSELK